MLRLALRSAYASLALWAIIPAPVAAQAPDMPTEFPTGLLPDDPAALDALPRPPPLPFVPAATCRSV